MNSYLNYPFVDQNLLEVDVDRILLFTAWLGYIFIQICL